MRWCLNYISNHNIKRSDIAEISRPRESTEVFFQLHNRCRIPEVCGRCTGAPVQQEIDSLLGFMLVSPTIIPDEDNSVVHFPGLFPLHNNDTNKIRISLIRGSDSWLTRTGSRISKTSIMLICESLTTMDRCITQQNRICSRELLRHEIRECVMRWRKHQLLMMHQLPHQIDFSSRTLCLLEMLHPSSDSPLFYGCSRRASA